MSYKTRHKIITSLINDRITSISHLKTLNAKSPLIELGERAKAKLERKLKNLEKQQLAHRDNSGEKGIINV